MIQPLPDYHSNCTLAKNFLQDGTGSMGVKGLWKILEPSARRISLDNLNGLVLAVGMTEVFIRKLV